ncbi:hypothetical protein [Sporosarcina sp. USHLN248]|uniref:hypothetical protein n=1 Tax=Sporosarcina sp. USHLN248 TaxID=3081300 RepID=UPI0030179491
MVGFLTGVLMIAILSVVLMLLLPEEMETDMMPIFKLTMGIWIIHSIASIFGHSLF